MDFFDLVNISEAYLELINPTSPEKILTVGTVLGLNEECRVIDFGAGYGEVLSLWGEYFGISGLGIDIREHACQRARKKLTERGFGGRIRIVCANGAEYPYDKGTYDVAACIGASFVWKGLLPALKGLKAAIHSNGRIVIGEPYWRTNQVPPEYAQSEKVHTELEILQLIRSEGFDLEYIVRASEDDWDKYEANNWFGLVQWIEDNPEHAELGEVINFLHKIQDEYFRYGRQYLGWAMWVMNPVHY